MWRLAGPWSITAAVVVSGVAVLALLSGNVGEVQVGADASLGATTAAGQYPVATTTKNGPVFDIARLPVEPSTTDKTAYLRWMLANTAETKDYLLAKWQRAQQLVADNHVSDPRVLRAFLRTPREDFFNVGSATRAYAKSAASIGYGQTISGPDLVAHMTQAIDPQPNQQVLEIGTGSGYQSAILSELSNHVYTIEIVPQLAQKADALYTKLSKSYPEYNNIRRENADGYYGWAGYAPFDRIIVTAGIDHIPPDLLSQLAPGGIMVIPVGPPSGQTVLKVTKQVAADGSVTFTREDIYSGRKVIFVPFKGG